MWDILGLPEGGRYSDSARNLACGTYARQLSLSDIRSRPKTGGEIKTLIVRISPKAVSRKSTSWSNRPAAPLARPTCRDPPTRGGGAEHPAARKHRALAPIRAPAARREMAGRGMETTDSQRLTVTPASPAASDALPGTPLPHAQKRARWALAGFLGTGSSASSRKARALWLHRSRQALHGPARLAGEAAARTAALGAVPGTVPDRPWPQPLRIES